MKRITGIKTYKVRRNENFEAEVWIDPHWVTFEVVEGLTLLEGNQDLDDHYNQLLKQPEMTREFIGRLEEFRQRYTYDRAKFIKFEDTQSCGI